MKALGYRPDVVITDLCEDYNGVVKEVFDGVIHHQCALHAERAANELLRKYLPDDEEFEQVRNRLKKRIREIFEADEAKELERRYNKLMDERDKFPSESSAVFEMLCRYYPRLHRCVKEEGIPYTSNSVENAIKEFDIKYQNTFGFTSLYAISDFLKVFTIYQRLSPIETGKWKGKSPRGLSGQELSITWDDWALAA